MASPLMIEVEEPQLGGPPAPAGPGAPNGGAPAAAPKPRSSGGGAGNPVASAAKLVQDLERTTDPQQFRLALDTVIQGTQRILMQRGVAVGGGGAPGMGGPPAPMGPPTAVPTGPPMNGNGGAPPLGRPMPRPAQAPPGGAPLGR